MNMLLITSFMLCTSLSKPQTMEISMLTNDKVTEEEQTKTGASQAVTCFWVWTTRFRYYFESPITRGLHLAQGDGLRSEGLSRDAAGP